MAKICGSIGASDKWLSVTPGVYDLGVDILQVRQVTLASTLDKIVASTLDVKTSYVPSTEKIIPNAKIYNLDLWEASQKSCGRMTERLLYRRWTTLS